MHTAVETAPVRSRAARRGQPGGTASMAERCRCLPARVASSAPRKPTHRVRCCTITARPGSCQFMRRASVAATGIAIMVSSTSTTARLPVSTAPRRTAERAARATRAASGRSGSAGGGASGIGGVSLTDVDRQGRSVYQYHELFRSPGKPVRPRLLATALLGLALAGCRSIALGAAADAVSGSGGSYGKDHDPELVKAAVPFGLKTMEGLLEEKPEHEGLLLSLASGFTQYGYAFVQQDAAAAEIQGRNAEARAGRERARALYLRARDYGLRGLEVRHAGLAARLRGVKDAEAALAVADCKEDVPLLYWTAAAWGAAIAAGKDRMDLVAELPAPVAMMRRALALDETFDDGAIHEFLLTYEASRSQAQGGGPAVARRHYQRALEISKGRKLAVHVNVAESVLVQTQDRAEFTRLLREVLQADPAAEPRLTLANVLVQRRARLLLSHLDDLFA